MSQHGNQGKEKKKKRGEKKKKQEMTGRSIVATHCSKGKNLSRHFQLYCRRLDLVTKESCKSYMTT
jgi:hypothetical protein